MTPAGHSRLAAPTAAAAGCRSRMAVPEFARPSSLFLQDFPPAQAFLGPLAAAGRGWSEDWGWLAKLEKLRAWQLSALLSAWLRRRKDKGTGQAPQTQMIMICSMYTRKPAPKSLCPVYDIIVFRCSPEKPSKKRNRAFFENCDEKLN